MLPVALLSVQLPPAGVAANDTLVPSHTAAFDVVLLADPGLEFTVKLTSDVVAPQAPLAATVYVTVTDSSVPISPVT